MTQAAEMLQCDAVLDLTTAEAFLAAVRRQMQTYGFLYLDASRVERLTSPCIQVILSAANHGPVRVENPSEAFAGAFADLGLDWPRHELPAPPIQPDRPAGGAAGDGSAAKRILTIDDSKTIRDMLRMTLADAGFEVLQAADGREGVAVMDRETVDLVITDINMPNMNGYDVVRHLRGRPELKGLPILVLTTESDADKKNLAREAGATGWMVKPFDPERLLQTVRKVIP